MTGGKVAAAALALSLLAGCVVHDRGDRGSAGVAADPHRGWWSEHHGQEAYDRGRAEREHREWCAHSPDRSCEGWH
ncbi:MAG TPA: hypothetical protein VF113_07345 [Stellaceae bacterium]